MTGQPRPGSRYRASCRCPPRPAARPRRRGDGCSAPACVAARAISCWARGWPAASPGCRPRFGPEEVARPHRLTRGRGKTAVSAGMAAICRSLGGLCWPTGRRSAGLTRGGAAGSSPTMALAPAAGDGGAAVPYRHLTRADADNLSEDSERSQDRRNGRGLRQLRKESFGECPGAVGHR